MKPTFRAALTACLLAAGLAPTAAAQTAPEDSVIGLWAFETSFPAVN